MTPDISVLPIESQTLWLYADTNNQPIGPFPFEELRRLLAAGTIRPETWVIENGGSQWRTFAEATATLPPPLPRNSASPAAKPAKRPRRWPTVLALFLLYPLGLILLCYNNAFSRRTKIALAIAFGLLFAVALFNPAPPLPPPSRSQANSASAKGTAAPAKKSLGLGDTFRLGDFSYTVYDCDVRESIGPRFARTEAAGNGVFVIVRYAIKNETNKTRTVVSDDFTLRDAAGRVFRPSSKALSALLFEKENKDFLLSELQPGLEHETATAFEVPSESADVPLVLIVPEKGFGGKKAEIRFQP